MKPFQILAVCSGNVCRSPFVELLLRDQLADRRDLATRSAGVIARPGMRMTDEMVRVAVAHGIEETDARAHDASRLDRRVIAESGLILCLTREHRSATVELEPRALRRAFTLAEFARVLPLIGGDRFSTLTPAQLVAEVSMRRTGAIAAADEDDVLDPIGLPYEVYAEVGSRMAGAVAAITAALKATRPALAEATPVRSPVEPNLSFSFQPRANG